MPKELQTRLIREALDVLSCNAPSTPSYRALCRRFLAQHLPNR